MTRRKPSPTPLSTVQGMYPSTTMDEGQWREVMRGPKGDDVLQRALDDLLRLGWDRQGVSGPRPAPSPDEQMRRLKILFWRGYHDAMPGEVRDILARYPIDSDHPADAPKEVPMTIPDVEWVDDLPPLRPRTASDDDPVLAALRARPGDWAVLRRFEGRPASARQSAASWATRRRPKLRSEGYELTSRGSVVYARFVGDGHSAEAA